MDSAHVFSAFMLLFLENSMKILALVVVLFAMAAVIAAKPTNRQLLRSMHQSLNEMCRGGSGDNPATHNACDVRTKVSELLRTIGSGYTETNGELALSIYKNLNEMCRGGSGDRQETLQACDVRNNSSALLRNLGYCWRGAWWKRCRS